MSSMVRARDLSRSDFSVLGAFDAPAELDRYQQSVQGDRRRRGRDPVDDGDERRPISEVIADRWAELE